MKLHRAQFTFSFYLVVNYAVFKFTTANHNKYVKIISALVKNSILCFLRGKYSLSSSLLLLSIPNENSNSINNKTCNKNLNIIYSP